MADASNDPGTQRVRDEVVARLNSRGVRTTVADSSEDLVQLLDAVEAFETAVEAAGGDLMVDEPIGNKRAAEPDDIVFVLPARGSTESARAYVSRIDQARADAGARRRA
jgi:hypothetical protein